MAYILRKLLNFYKQRKIEPFITDFIKANRNFFNEYKRQTPSIKRNIILCEKGKSTYKIPYWIFANILAKNKGAVIAYLGNADDNYSLSRIRKSFGESINFSVDKISDKHSETIHNEAIRLVNSIKEPKDLLELKYDGLYVGDLIYDQHMREGRWQASVWKIDDRTLRVFKRFLKYYFVLKEINIAYNVCGVVFSHTVGIESGGLPLRFFAKLGVETFSGSLGVGNIKKHTFFNGKRLRHTACLEDKIFEKILSNKNFFDITLMRANDFLKKRFSGYGNDMDSTKAFSSSKKIYSDVKKFCKDFNLNEEKPIVFVMLHAFNDFPHHFEHNLYLDYYRWFIDTLKVAQSNKKVNWVFKEHPSAHLYPDDSNLNGIFEITCSNHDHIIYLDRNCCFNTFSLRYIAHAVVTCIGTAALEFSCFGIPSIIAGDNFFSEYNICIKPNCLKQYHHILKTLGSDNSVLPSLDEKMVKKSKILFYLIHNFCFGPFGNNIIVPFTTHEQRLKGLGSWYFNYITRELNKARKESEPIKKIEEFIKDYNRKDLITLEDIILTNQVEI